MTCKSIQLPRGALPHVFYVGLVALAMHLPATGHAGLMATTVNVTLSSPNDPILGTSTPPIDVSRVVTVVDPGIEVSVANCPVIPDGSLVDCYLGTTGSGLHEFIDFKNSEIDMRIWAGNQDANTGQFVTGYSTGAQWIFSGLPTDLTAIGVSFPSNQIDSVPTPWITLDTTLHEISVPLDSIIFHDQGNGSSNNYADVTINLQFANVTPPGNVPEPGSLSLVGAALALVLLPWRRLHRAYAVQSFGSSYRRA